MKVKLTCIECPKGCKLIIDKDNNYIVSGFGCIKGKEFGERELINPLRVVTSTVKIIGGRYKRLPVKTKEAVPKDKIFEVMNHIKKIEVESPIDLGTVIIKNVANTGIDIISTTKM